MSRETTTGLDGVVPPGRRAGRRMIRDAYAVAGPDPDRQRVDVGGLAVSQQGGTASQGPAAGSIADGVLTPDGQSAGEVGRDLVSNVVRHVIGGVASEQSKYVRAEVGGVQVGTARDDMEVEVLKTLCFREQRYIGFLALNDLPQGCREVAEQWSEFSRLLGSQLVEREDMPTRDQH